MYLIITYDISTESADGRRRLKKIGKVCAGYGVRVQKSVFECRLSREQFVELEERLTGMIDEKKDRLRVYYIQEPLDRHIRNHGRDDVLDVAGPLIF